MVLVGKSESESAEIWNTTASLLEELHNKFNRFDRDSEVSFVNLYAHSHPVKLSDDLWNVLSDCRRYFKKTNGLFDVTLKDFNQICFDKKDKSIFFNSEETTIDLGGYAKGYATERIKNSLVKNGATDVLIDFGNSSILAMGKHPYGNSWKLAVPNPLNQSVTLYELELSNQSLSTSGNTPSHTKHIIDKRTGEFSDAQKIVSVIAENAIDAEVLSTTLMIAQPEDVESILTEFQIDRHIIYNL